MPSAAGCKANVPFLGELSGAGLRLGGRCGNRNVRERGARRNIQLIDGVYRELVKVGEAVGVSASRVGNLVIQKASCRVLSMICMKPWTVDRVNAIVVLREW